MFALFATATARAQTSYPMLMSLKPVAAQIGATTEHEIQSRYSMLGAYKVIVTGEGVTGEIVPPEIKNDEKDKTPKLEAMKVRFTVAPDARAGVRDFRIATPQGASTLGQLVVGRDTVISESDKNDTPTDAQAIDLPATVCGTIEKAEDVDFFKFQAKAGDAISFHVRSMRLQNKIHDLQQHSDPILTLRNAAGVTVAASDNYFFGDPLITHNFEHSGEYLLEIRDVRYQGNKYWDYCIEISARPVVTGVFPFGVALGQETKLELVGFRLPEEPIATVNLPPDTAPGTVWSPLLLGEVATDPLPLTVAKVAIVTESAEDNGTPATAEAVRLPGGINGRMNEPGDIDCFSFEAKKDERYSFEVIARRGLSTLDSHLRILDESGKQLELSDDMKLGKRSYSDSWIENWQVPDDGKFAIEIRDLHLRGGPRFGYFLEVTRSAPYFELYVDTDKTQLTPGTGGAIYVRAVRKNGFDGEIELAIDGLPDGVSAECGRILAGKSEDGCILLQAVADAQPAMQNIVISGTAKHEMEGAATLELAAIATSYQETYQPGGGRGHWPVEMHTVCIGAPSDIVAVKLSANEVTLKPGESKRIDVTIERAEGFDKNVLLDVIYKHLNSVYGNSLPQGVTLDGGNSKTLLTSGATEGHITLKAADDAPPAAAQVVPVMANVSLNFVMKRTYAGLPLRVSVASTGE
jgi:hypothetical protein